MAVYPRLRPARTPPGRNLLDAPGISVLLANDHAAMYRALRGLLDGENGVEVIAEASDLAAVVEQARRGQPHVLVLDLGVPGASGLHTVTRLRILAPDTQIVLLTMEASPIFAQQALAAGVLGLVAKDHADSELLVAVRAAAQGKRYLSPRVAARLDVLSLVHTEDRLSEREIEILRLIALGYTSVEAARQLSLSPRTVESHRAHITSKLGLSTRAELVGYALGRGLLRA